MSRFPFLNRNRPAPAVGIAPVAPTPLTLRLRHIDIELGKLRTVEPRTDITWGALDYWLDRRLVLRPAVNPGCGDVVVAGQRGQHCEICEREIRPGEIIADQPGTGGLVQHRTCPGGEGGSR